MKKIFWSIRKRVRFIKNRLFPQADPNLDFVKWKKLRLPPPHRRFCTEEWRDDNFFVESAKSEVDRLVKIGGLTQHSTVLDIGSGQGRLAIGLIDSFPDLKGYYGLEVSQSSVSWCKHNLSAFHNNFKFIHYDIKNERYNPHGVPFRPPIQMPFREKSFDVVFLYSVFTHMRSADISEYLKDIRRVLRANGHGLFTVYVEENCENETENPEGYLDELGKSVGPLHRVRFNKSFFEALIRTNGLTIADFFPLSEQVTKQSVYLVTRGQEG